MKNNEWGVISQGKSNDEGRQERDNDLDKSRELQIKVHMNPTG